MHANKDVLYNYRKKMKFHMHFKELFLLLTLAVPLLTVGACSTNPATGKQSFTAFMSAEKEKEIGAAEHPKIIERFGGIYQDKKLSFACLETCEILGQHIPE